MRNFINQILFGKYQVLSLLGTGSFGSVYLSKHLILECYRAIKIIPKQEGNLHSSLSEAQLLKSLKHPGIPTIYDVEEDASFFYIVEEYIEGESLESFLLHQSHISHSFFLEICMQLCDIFRYLHTLTPAPVLYLDLKPEHIIVCGMEIKLIDFNVATYLSNLGNIYTLLGNEDFSAPELFSGNMPNLLSDIYSLGKIIEYLSAYVDTPISPKFQQTIKKATAADSACRLETVDQLISAIQQEKSLAHQTHLRKKIVVMGSHPGCGTTHISISLVSTLNYLGYSTVYYEKKPEGNLRTAMPFVPFMYEKEGRIHYHFFKGYPLYGPGVQLPQPTEEISVYNYGDSFPPGELDFDLIFYVCDTSVWHRRIVYEKGDSLLCNRVNLKIICNCGNKKAMNLYAKHFSQPVYHYPYDTQPFLVNKEKCSFVKQLLQIKRRSHLFSQIKNLLIPNKSLASVE